MLKTLLITLFIGISIANLAQKKRWTSSNGELTKKSLATSYYIKTKVKGSNSFLVKRYHLDHEKPFETISYLDKKQLIKKGTYISYYSDGSIKIKGEYFNNQKSGTWESFDKNSKLNNISNFSNGKLHGAYTNYFKDGKIETGTYKNGKKNLLWSYTNHSNQLISTTLYSNGEKEGKSQLFHDNGNIKEIIIYKADEITKVQKFDFEGNEIIEEDYQDEEVFDFVEEQPKFPGGMDKMMRYLARKTQYPEVALEMGIQGKVYVSFIIEKDGTISDVKVIRGVHKSLDKEAIRVVKSMPKWTPGIQKGKKVKVKYNLPINFRLS